MERTTRFALASVLLFFVSLQFHTWVDPDIWSHLVRGREIWSQKTFLIRSPFILTHDHAVQIYSLFQLVCYGVFNLAHEWGVTVLLALFWTVTLLELMRVIQVRKAGVSGILWLGAAIILLQLRMLERPEVFFYTFLMGQLLILCKWEEESPIRRSEVCLLVLLQILSGNTHTYSILGPCLIFLLALAKLIEGKRTKSFQFIGVTITLLLASCISPYGSKTFFFMKTHLGETSLLRHQIGELSPTTGFPLTHPFFLYFWIFWTATLLGVGYLILKTPKKTFPLLLALVGLVLSARTLRFIPYVVFFSAPLWKNIFPRLKLSSTEFGRS